MIEVRGADQLADLSKALKAAGRQDLQRELSRGLSAAAKPFIADVRKAASRLPQHGGFSRRVARTPMRVVKRSSGVRVQARSPWGIGQVDKGILWHPVFSRDVWVKQSVPSGFWSEPAKGNERNARHEAQKALDRVAAKIERSV